MCLLVNGGWGVIVGRLEYNPPTKVRRSTDDKTFSR